MSGSEINYQKFMETPLPRVGTDVQRKAVLNILWINRAESPTTLRELLDMVGLLEVAQDMCG